MDRLVVSLPTTSLTSRYLFTASINSATRGFTVALALLLCATLTSASPVPTTNLERWKSPCSDPVTPRPSSFTNQLTNTLSNLGPLVESQARADSVIEKVMGDVQETQALIAFIIQEVSGRDVMWS